MLGNGHRNSQIKRIVLLSGYTDKLLDGLLKGHSGVFGSAENGKNGPTTPRTLERSGHSVQRYSASSFFDPLQTR